MAGGGADRARVASRRRGNSDDDTARVIVGLIVLGVMTGVVQRFLARWWPVLAAGGVLLVLLLVWLSVLRHRRRVRERRLLQELDRQIRFADQLSPREFEELIARLLVQAGWADVRVSGGAGDLGADVTARSGDGRVLVVQCKRYAPHRQVSSPEMQRFLGTVWNEHHADLAWFVTTGRFTGPAADLARRNDIELIPRPRLAAWMSTGQLAADPTQRV